MTKSLFLSAALVVLPCISYSTAQAMDDDVAASSCATTVCSAICAKAGFGYVTLCNSICPNAGSTAITAGCQSSTPCATICSTGALSKIASFCTKACNAAGPAIATACKSCTSSSPFEDDQEAL